MRYRSLDGLRGVAAYAVVASHFASMTGALQFPFNQAGRLGVMLFFILSGFLMGKLYLLRAFDASEVGGFFRKRVARVVPLYIFAVLVSFALVLAIGSAWPLFKIDASNILDHLFFVKGTDVLWTVAAEVQFYVAFPLVWFLFRKTDAATTALGLILAIGLCVLFWDKSSPVFFRVAPFFLLGIMASMIKVERSKAVDFLFLASAAAVCLSLPAVKAAIGFPRASNWDSVMHMATIFVLLLSAANSNLADRLLGNRFMAFFGTISYSVYVLHLPALRVLNAYGLLAYGTAVSVLVALATTTLVAAASYYVIENPMRRLINGEYGRKGEALQTARQS